MATGQENVSFHSNPKEEQCQRMLKVKVKGSQSCLTVCDPMDYTVHGILHARILERVAFSSPGDLPNPGIKYRSPALQADSLPAEPQGKPKNVQTTAQLQSFHVSKVIFKILQVRLQQYLNRELPDVQAG